MKNHISPVASHNERTVSGLMAAIPQAKNGSRARLVTIFGSVRPSREKYVHYIFDVGDPDYHEIVLPVNGPVSSINVPVASGSMV